MTEATPGGSTLRRSGEADSVWARCALDAWPPFAFLAGILLLWHAAVSLNRVPAYIVPSPVAVAQRLWEYRTVLTSDLGTTLLEAVSGFAVGSAIAVVTGVLIGSFRLLHRAAYPVLVALQAVPVVAIAPLIIIWFGNSILGKAVMAALICYFPVAVNVIAGVQSSPSEARDLFQTLAATRWQTFVKLTVPYSLPYVITGLRIGAGLSSVGAVVSELAGAQRGLGFRILIASYQLDTPLMFAAMVVAGLLGVGLFYLVVFIGRRLTWWADA